MDLKPIQTTKPTLDLETRDYFYFESLFGYFTNWFKTCFILRRLKAGFGTSLDFRINFIVRPVYKLVVGFSLLVERKLFVLSLAM